MSDVLESSNGVAAYTFELAELNGDDVVARKTVRLSAVSSLQDLHQLILKAFRLEDDEVFPGERYADLPFVFYMNNVSEDYSCAYVSECYEDARRLNDEAMAQALAAITGMGIRAGRFFRAILVRLCNPIPKPRKPAGLTPNARLQDFDITTETQFLYDLGIIPQLMLAVKCRKIETISDPAEAIPTILMRRRKKTSP